MEKLTDIAALYFKRRTYFRLFLIVLIISFWSYIEISDLFPVRDHDLNYHAVSEIKRRYKGGPFTFAVLGDNKNSPVFNTTINALNHDPSLQFAIIGGDLVLYPTSETYATFLSQWRKLRIPMLALPGNHDVSFHNRYFYYTIFGRFYYSFSLGNAKFILLDDSDEIGLGNEQMAWLEKELEDSARYTYRFVFMHVPLWDPRDSLHPGIRFSHCLKDPDIARRLEDLFVKYKVTILFASHIHAYYNYSGRGLHTIITGGAGAELAGKDPAHTFYHYVRVRVGEPGIQTDLVKIELKTPFSGLRKYLNVAKIYILTFGKMYFKRIILGFFILILLTDAILEFLFRRKEGRH